MIPCTIVFSTVVSLHPDLLWLKANIQFIQCSKVMQSARGNRTSLGGSSCVLSYVPNLHSPGMIWDQLTRGWLALPPDSDVPSLPFGLPWDVHFHDPKMSRPSLHRTIAFWCPCHHHRCFWQPVTTCRLGKVNW